MTKNSKRIFIVEDEAILLCDLEDIVLELGFDHAGSATSVDQAMDFLASGPDIDLGLLDLNLNGQPSDPIADHLLAAGIPVLFVSGYGRRGLADRFADCHVLQKPYDERKLAAALELMLNTRA
ncbi:response regulator [Hyphomonas sp.]|jgi:CheY-like chemotaxis protein|uniref:response regulator n=1 Tax=Hyphomonas sp. TaxID=87 RepID=UPI0039E6A80B